MTKLISTTVVRGSQQDESHGGVYLLDLDARTVVQAIDWNKADIDWQGRGGDRGLRGIACDGETIYIAASDELLAYTPDFLLINSWRNPYLRHCHEICVYQRNLFLASTAFDSILGFDLDQKKFHWAMHVRQREFQFAATLYDPQQDDGPIMLNKLHLNNVFSNQHGMYLTGLHSGGMLHFNGKQVNMAVELPSGTHNARPFRDGVLFNDSDAGALRYAGRSSGAEDRAMQVPKYPEEQLIQTGDGLARQGFARGLCLLSDTIVAGGSSPATIAIYDLAANVSLLSVALTMDVRNTTHSLAVWPYD